LLVNIRLGDSNSNQKVSNKDATLVQLEPNLL
jgi:hypothetical protein